MNKETSIIDKSRNKPNYHAIDLAKFICSILVVMIHYKPFGEAESGSILWYLNFFLMQYLGRLAVPFFFVTSGFFLYKKTSLENFKIEPVKQYALRILRLYGLWTVIYFPLAFLKFFRDEKGIGHAFLVYIANTVLSGSYRHLWYLNATIFSVMLVAVLLSRKISPRKITISAFCFYVMMLFFVSWFGLITPLRELTPDLWQFLKSVREVVDVPKFGLFSGFLFIAIGMDFAFYRFSMKKNTALIGFIVSMLFMFLESFGLQYLGFSRQHDIYLFLIPASFFLFYLIQGLKLPDNKIYKTLRILSSLIFYTHIWVGSILKLVLGKINESLAVSSLLFITTLAVTMLLSYCIMKCSEKPKLNWLKKLYT